MLAFSIDVVVYVLERGDCSGITTDLANGLFYPSWKSLYRAMVCWYQHGWLPDTDLIYYLTYHRTHRALIEGTCSSLGLFPFIDIYSFISLSPRSAHQLLASLSALVAFSACGGLRTDKSLTAYLASCLWHLGKGRIVRDTTTRRLTYRINGLFYPSWNRLYRITAYR